MAQDSLTMRLPVSRGSAVLQEEKDTGEEKEEDNPTQGAESLERW